MDEKQQAELVAYGYNPAGLAAGGLGQPLIAQPIMGLMPMLAPPADLPKEFDSKNFQCAHCGSQYVTNPVGRGGSSRRKLNPNATPAQLNRMRKPRAARPRSAIIDGQKVL